MKKQDLKQLPSSQAAFPVSPSPPQGSEGALRMNATCGRKCAALLPSCGPVGCLGKMLLASSIWGSTKRFLTWQKRDTLFSHSYFRLAASAHGMSASELLSSRLMFPTPLASDKNTCRDAANLDVYLSDNGICRKVWVSGKKVVKFIGYDAGEHYRSDKVLLRDLADPKYSKWYPLMEWGWDREACIRAIEAAGLPQPGKSSCFFCPSMRAEEIIDLREHYPDLFRRALALEDNARANLKTVQGLGRNYSWRERFGKEFI